MFILCYVLSQAGHLHKHIKKIFLASKPPPVIESVFKGEFWIVVFSGRKCFPIT
jgi:hypothetical protein